MTNPISSTMTFRTPVSAAINFKRLAAFQKFTIAANDFASRLAPTTNGAVNLLLRHQPFYIVRLDASAVEDTNCGGTFRRKLLGGEFAQKAVNRGCNFRRRSPPRTNGPDRFVS